MLPNLCELVISILKCHDLENDCQTQVPLNQGSKESFEDVTEFHAISLKHSHLI